MDHTSPGAKRALSAIIAFLLISACGSEGGTGPSGGGCGATALHHPAGTIARTSPLKARPFGIAVSTCGAVYVTQLDSAQLTRFDLTGNRITAIPVGNSPTDVTFSADGSTAYDTDQGDGSITRVTVSGNTNKGSREFAASTFRVRAVGDQVFVTDNAATLHVLDATSGAQLDSVPVDADPNGLAFDPDGSRMFVAAFNGGVVDLVSRSSFTVTGSYAVGGNPQDIALTPDGSELYVAGAAGGVRVWNTVTGDSITTVPFSTSAFGLAVAPDGKQAWASVPGSGVVLIIDIATRTVVGSIPTGGIPRRIAFSADGKTGVIANEAGWVDFVR